MHMICRMPFCPGGAALVFLLCVFLGNIDAHDKQDFLWGDGAAHGFLLCVFLGNIDAHDKQDFLWGVAPPLSSCCVSFLGT